MFPVRQSIMLTLGYSGIMLVVTPWILREPIDRPHLIVWDMLYSVRDDCVAVHDELPISL